MIAGVTKSGFEFKINEKIVSDWRFVKLLARTKRSETEEDAFACSVEIAEIILGDGENDLCQHVMDEEGNVPAERIFGEVNEIIEIANEKTNESKN